MEGLKGAPGFGSVLQMSNSVSARAEHAAGDEGEDGEELQALRAALKRNQGSLRKVALEMGAAPSTVSRLHFRLTGSRYKNVKARATALNSESNALCFAVVRAPNFAAFNGGFDSTDCFRDVVRAVVDKNGFYCANGMRMKVPVAAFRLLMLGGGVQFLHAASLAQHLQNIAQKVASSQEDTIFDDAWAPRIWDALTASTSGAGAPHPSTAGVVAPGAQALLVLCGVDQAVAQSNANFGPAPPPVHAVVEAQVDPMEPVWNSNGLAMVAGAPSGPPVVGIVGVESGAPPALEDADGDLAMFEGETPLHWDSQNSRDSSDTRNYWDTPRN